MADTPPPPPPGFSLDPPPPPPGFRMDSAAAPPPPPPAGFKLDTPPTPSTLSQIGSAVAAPFQAAGQGLKNIATETMKEGVQNAYDIKGDLTAPIKGKPKQGVGNYVSKDITAHGTEEPNLADYLARGGKTAIDIAQRPAIPAFAAARETLGKAGHEASGGYYDPDVIANMALLAQPMAESKLLKGAAGLVEKGGRKILGLPEAAPKPPKPPEGFTLDKPLGAAMPSEGPLTRPPALTQPRTFEDQLFQLESNRVADKVDILKAANRVPDISGDSLERMYHYEENPKGEPLTAEEQKFYNEHVLPWATEGNALHKELEELTGEKIEDDQTAEGHTPRYVAGRTRSFGEVLDRWKRGLESKFQGGAAARSMRATVDAQKSRRFYNAVSPDGEKMVVHIGRDGKVSAFDGSDDPAGPEFGQFPKGQKLGPGSKLRAEGQTWRLENATTKEIEAVAKTRYLKNVLANRMDNVAKLRSAVRNAKFIQAMKASPEWANVAIKKDAVLDPPKTNGREWRMPKTPQFGQYYMEPTLADALDDAAGRTRDLDGLANGLDRAGNLVKGSIFWNPIPHIRNVANHYFVDKGLVGTAASVVKGGVKLAKGEFPATLRAARAVMTQNEDYMRALRAGGALPYARSITADLHKALTTKLGEDVAANPQQWGRIAQIAGYANPIEMVKRVYKASNAMLWGASDIMTVARYMDRMEKGLPLEKAIRETETHMPNYRVPGQVGGTRLMSQILTSPIATMFGRYQYNRLASYMHMAQTLVQDPSIKNKAEVLDKLAALGVMLTLYYPALDKAWQKITGNQNAKVTRPGAASVPQAAIDVAKGDKTLSQGAQSVFSPGIVETPIEAFHGRYLYSGQPIAYPENLTDGHPDQFARDIGAYIASKIAPVGQAQSVIGGSKTPEQFMLSQIGVTEPTDESVAAKQKYGVRDTNYARRRAAKKENQRK